MVMSGNRFARCATTAINSVWVASVVINRRISWRLPRCRAWSAPLAALLLPTCFVPFNLSFCVSASGAASDYRCRILSASRTAVISSLVGLVGRELIRAMIASAVGSVLVNFKPPHNESREIYQRRVPRWGSEIWYRAPPTRRIAPELRDGNAGSAGRLNGLVTEAMEAIARVLAAPGGPDEAELYSSDAQLDDCTRRILGDPDVGRAIFNPLVSVWPPQPSLENPGGRCTHGRGRAIVAAPRGQFAIGRKAHRACGARPPFPARPTPERSGVNGPIYHAGHVAL
jgi:hypothetical protein